LISVAYAPGTRRHIKAALRHGATIAEIIEVLNLCVVQGVQAFNLGGPILAKELVVRSDSALIDGSSFFATTRSSCRSVTMFIVSTPRRIC
jgi:hypothetical protein